MAIDGSSHKKSHTALSTSPSIIPDKNTLVFSNELDTAKLRATAAFLSSREDVATLAGEALTRLIYGEGHPLARPMSILAPL